MKALFVAALALGGMVSSPAMANLDLAKSKNCMSCHSMDKKVLGPAFKDVASKYANQKGAEALLAQKIMKGSSGVWGTIPMPPNAVSEKEAQALSKWVLSVK